MPRDLICWSLGSAEPTIAAHGAVRGAIHGCFLCGISALLKVKKRSTSSWLTSRLQQPNWLPKPNKLSSESNESPQDSLGTFFLPRR